MRKDCSSDPEKVLKFKTDSQEFATILRSIYSNSERQLQFLKHNAFVTFSGRFLRSDTLEKLEFKLEKIIWI